jgi:(2Fe-2S) ferredoxin
MNGLQTICRSCLSPRYRPCFIKQRGFASSALRPQIPADILEQIDVRNPLANSVNLYVRHVSLSTGTYDWPSTVKEDKDYGPDQPGGSSFRLSQFAVDWATLLKPNKKLLYTKSSHSSERPCLHLYPDNLQVTFKSQHPPISEIETFMSHLNSSPFPSLDFVNIKKLPPGTVHIYACTHNARDRRCGVIGQLVIRRLREYLASSSPSGMHVEVFGCSHVGGHKFAGNVAIYRPEWRQGVWYGRITPDDVEAIINKTVCEGKVLGSHWRGGLPDGTWDPKLGLTAEDVEKLSLHSCEFELESSECSCREVNIG